MANNLSVKLAQNNYKVLCAMLDEKKWKYEKEEEKLSINCTARGDDLPMDIIIKFNTDMEIVSLFSPMPFTVPDDKRNDLAIAIARANYNMVDGSFDYSYTKGRIVFRLTASYSNCLLSKDMYEYMLLVSCSTIDAYNDKFLAVCKKEMSVEEILNLIK